MRRVCSLVVLAGLAFFSAVAAGSTVQSVDFTGAPPPSGWTVTDGAWRSPVYAGAVDRIELRYSGADAAASASVQAFPANSEEGVDVATFTAASAGASFDFPETTDFRSFSITTNGLALSSFTAYVAAASLDVPSGVVISNNTTGTSFDAAWSTVEDATGYTVYVWTNAVVGASAGTVEWQETMPGATNASSSSVMNDEKFAACFENAGWSRSAKAGYSTGEEGTIRIGIKGEDGWIQTPQINHSSDGMTVRFYAKAFDPASDGKSIAVERVSGDGTTILAGTATLTTEMQEFTIALPGWESGDCIRFNSITNGDRRTVLGTVTVVSGYSEGRLEPSYIVDGLDVGAATVYSFTGLPSVPVLFAVEAYGRRGASSAKTDAVVVDLSNPDKVAVLNACPMSSLTSSAHTYTQNFDSLAATTATTGDKEWLNGTTLLYWQAYKGGNAVTSYKYNGGGANSGGLYALATNQSHAVRALGVLSTQSDEFSFGIAFTNDTDRTLSLSSLSYAAQQWGFRNNTNQTLSVSAKVVDDLDWISSYGDGWTRLAETESVVYGTGDAHDTPVSTQVTVNPEEEIAIAPGQVLMLKWTIHSLKSGTLSVMGIDDVEVGFAATRARQFYIRIANAQGTEAWK